MPDSALADVQGGTDTRGIALTRAGVADLRLPLTFTDTDGQRQATVATASAWAAVSANERGAHMSRLVTAVGSLRDGLSLADLPAWLAALATRMKATAVGCELEFALFVQRPSPITDQASWLDYTATLGATQQDAQATVTVAVTVPVKMLCPCSKEISQDGAHAQRAKLTVQVWPTAVMPALAELVALAENSASAPLHAVLKRADEKHITEAAYAKPRFAEDAVREAAAVLAADERWTRWQVRIVNFESIHNHQVFAEASSTPTP